MATPTWTAATTGQPTQAGQINQFLGTHSTSIVYNGAITSQQTTAGTGSVSTLNTFIAQSVTTSSTQTTLGRVILRLSKTGTPPPVTVSLQTDNAGQPSGIALVATPLPPDLIPTSLNNVTIPLPTAVTPSTKYWIVLSADGTTGNVVNWGKSNQTSGASISTDGVSWTAQAFGLLYIFVDNTLKFTVAHFWDDGGARWATIVTNTIGQMTTLAEFCVGQTPTGYFFSQRSFAYNNGFFTGTA